MSGCNLIIACRTAQDRQANFSRAIGAIERNVARGTKAFHFDFDRVVCNPDKANVETVRQTLKEFRLEPCHGVNGNFAAICCGQGPKWVLITLVPSLGSQPEKLDEMVAFMSARAAENVGLIEKTPLTDVLAQLKVLERLNTIMTNRNKTAIHPAIAHLGIQGALDFVFYVSRILRPKPETQMFSAGVEWTRVSKEESFFIDDNIVCVRAARSFGMPAYHLRWGDGRRG